MTRPNKPHGKLTRRSTRGASLVELMAVMSANAALLGIIGSALAAINRSDRQFSERYRQMNAHAPLLDRLREDIHAAGQIHWAPEERELSLTSDDGPTIVYALRDNVWQRIASLAADPAAEGELTDAFTLPPSAVPRVTPIDAAAGEVLTIHWRPSTRTTLKTRRPALPIELIAEVGRDLRLLNE